VIRRDKLIILGQWILLGALVGLLCGAASALFLWLLELATDFRGGHELIVFTLPLAGLLIGWFYERFGQPIKGGSDLILDTVHERGPEIPLRMAPMVLIGTVLTHLFGGSAGREGTAVQMGASLSDWVAHRLRVGPRMRRQLLAAGAAGGFGSVFGTPIAGAIFGLEFLVRGRLVYDALVPALIASIIGDMTTRALGIGHTHYPIVPVVPLTLLLLLKWLVFAAAVALVTAVFIELTHRLKKVGQQRLPRLSSRMAFGGLLVVLLWQIVGTSDYLGLGVPMIVRAFEDPNFPAYAFALKLLFTAVTLGAGFLGGEVTPLFFIGAALGAALAHLLGLPIALAAGVGLAAVFAAAANAPLALSIMAVELLGPAVFPHVVIVAALAYVFSGHRSIYPAQRLLRGPDQSHLVALRDYRPRASAHEVEADGGASGTHSVNDEPAPSELVAVSDPPSSRASLLESARPSPDPP
jgi:H+/Cl- antiporter ClcA